MSNIADLFGPDCPVPSYETARDFSLQFGNDLRSWWAAAPEGAWLFWIAAHCNVDEHLLIDAAVDCVELGMKYVPSRQEKLNAALEVARLAMHGKIGDESIRSAADSAYRLVRKFLKECCSAAARVAGAVDNVVVAALHRSDRTKCIEFATRAVFNAALGARDSGDERGFREMSWDQAEHIRHRIAVDQVLSGLSREAQQL